jgi:signal transduction histidine kinase
VEDANAQLERQALELELQQAHLQEQAEELRALNEQLVERTQELERQRAIAEQASRAKSDFLAVMSHELRTPLNAIGGYVQLLEMGIHGPVTPAQAEALAKVARSQRHLLSLVNDVLNLARVEAGRVEYTIEPVPLREVVEAVLPMVEPQLDAGHLRFEIDVPADVVARADRAKLEQILLNLISNAVKFTPPDGTVRVQAGSDSQEPACAFLRVIDTGIGIELAQLAEIFEPFVQVDASHTRRAQGTGLGLAISRDLARGMGGDLTATSTPGVGSTFTLTLPRVF